MGMRDTRTAASVLSLAGPDMAEGRISAVQIGNQAYSKAI